MAKRLIKYLLHHRDIPYFVDDGGYFKIGHELVGVSRDDDCCYLPSGIVQLTNQNLIDRVVSLTLTDSAGTELTTQEKDDLANSWLTEKGF